VVAESKETRHLHLQGSKDLEEWEFFMDNEPFKMQGTYYFEVSRTSHPAIQLPWRPKSSISQLYKPQNTRNV